MARRSKQKLSPLKQVQIENLRHSSHCSNWSREENMEINKGVSEKRRKHMSKGGSENQTQIGNSYAFFVKRTEKITVHEISLNGLGNSIIA